MFPVLCPTHKCPTHTFVLGSPWPWPRGLKPSFRFRNGELRKDPAANPNSCLTYKEVAIDGRLGVDIELPESIRNELTASP